MKDCLRSYDDYANKMEKNCYKEQIKTSGNNIERDYESSVEQECGSNSQSDTTSCDDKTTHSNNTKLMLIRQLFAKQYECESECGSDKTKI